MKNVKYLGFGVILLSVLGMLFVWQVGAQEETGADTKIYLPWIAGNSTQNAAVSAAIALTPTPPYPAPSDNQLLPDEMVNIASSVTILKPGEYEGFVPTPFPEAPLPTTAIALTPGQPPPIRPRPSREELEQLLQRPTVAPDVPYVNYAVYDFVPMDNKSLSLNSEVIVIAQVTQIHPAQWSTLDGKRPSNPHTATPPVYIYTRTDVQVAEVVFGDAKPGDVLTLVKNGGQIGADKLVVDDGYAQFVEGQILLLYLDSIMGKVPEIPGATWRVNQQYEISRSTNIAVNPFATRKLDELIAEIKEIVSLKPFYLEQQRQALLEAKGVSEK